MYVVRNLAGVIMENEEIIKYAEELLIAFTSMNLYR